MRRAFTLVELTVATAIGVLIVILAYNTIVLMTRSERAIDRESLGAITESTMMQALLMDVRSAVSIEDAGPQEYRIKRLVLPEGGGALTPKTVTWKADAKTQKVTRTSDEGTQEFVFPGPLDPRRPALRLRLERTSDAMFAP